jgi:hypothetical protein
LTTLDTDVAVPAKLPVGDQDIRERLLAHGFTEELLGDSRPPATHYRLGGEASGFYAEFLTPLIGSEYDRKHKRKATIDIAGIVSQQLRHIELLLHHPWSIDFESDGFAAKIQIVNPVSFLAQKVLIHEKREREDRAKDILYMHDTLQVFGARLPELRELWRSIVAPQLQPRSANKVSKASEDLFGALGDDTAGRRRFLLNGRSLRVRLARLVVTVSSRCLGSLTAKITVDPRSLLNPRCCGLQVWNGGRKVGGRIGRRRTRRLFLFLLGLDQPLLNPPSNSFCRSGVTKVYSPAISRSLSLTSNSFGKCIFLPSAENPECDGLLIRNGADRDPKLVKHSWENTFDRLRNRFRPTPIRD